MKRLFVITLILCSLAACGSATRTAGSSTEKPGTATDTSGIVLAKMVAEGGRCVYGVCRSELVIQEDGAYSFTDGKEPARHGTIDTADLGVLTQQIPAVDFAAIRAQAFSGDCPTAYDGQEYIFELTTAAGIEVLRSCQSQIDLRAEPFATLMKIRDQMRQH